MFKFFKSKFNNFSLSKEYFIFSSVTLSALFILSVFYYCYSYSFYISEKNQKLKNVTHLLQQEIEYQFKDLKTKNGKILETTHVKKIEKDLNDYFNKIGEKNEVNFILVDNQCHILFKSIHNLLENKSTICEETSVDSIKGAHGFLAQAFMSGSTNYTYYQKIKDYSYTIFAGYDKNLFERELHEHVLPKLYNLLFMGSFCLIVLFFFRRKIITPISILSDCAIQISKGNTTIKIPKQNSLEMFNLAKALILVKHYIKKNENYRRKLELANEIIHASAEAREDFAKSINQELIYPLKEILVYTEILLNDSVKKHTLPTDLEKTIKCIEKIREAAINIKTKTSNSLNLSYFDFNAIVKQAVQINLKSSFLKKIDIIITNEADNIPNMYGDELKLTKILVCLISQSIENSPENQAIQINLSTVIKNAVTCIQLIIKDYSFGLSEEELQKIQENIGWENENPLFENIEYKYIEKFITMHKGTFYIENKFHEGRTVILTFPILKEPDFTVSKTKENVFYLNPKESFPV